MPTAASILSDLEKKGSENIRRIYARHGMAGARVYGVKVADSHQPRLLFETGLPTRYYLPLVDVRLDLLHPSETTTRCPYKGTASYWSVEAGDKVVEDLAWIYRTPVQESVRIAGLACFYNEKVDLIVDGERQERPKTPFS